MARKRYSDEQLGGAAPQPTGLLGNLGNAALSGLSATANALDLIPSMARDVVGGATTGNWSKYNPVDQLASPLSGKNRFGTRDILRDLKLVGPKDNWSNWAVGTAGDILIDPLLPFNFGARAGGAAGKLVKSAGVFDDIGRIASSKAGKLGSVGAREARHTLKISDIATHAPEQFERIKTTAANQGLDLNSLMNEPLGGMAKNWLTGTVYGGQTAQKVAKGLDWASDAVRHFELPGGLQPVGDTLNLFSKRSGGGRSRTQLQEAGRRFSDREALIAKHGTAIGKIAHDLKQLGHTDADKDKLLGWVEYPHTAPPQFQPVVGEIRGLLDGLPPRAKAIGYDTISDVARRTKVAGGNALYAPHQMTHSFQSHGPGGGADFATKTPAASARYPWEHSSKGGAPAMKELGPFVNKFYENGGIQDDLPMALEAQFGHNFDSLHLSDEQFGAMADSKKWNGQETVANAQALHAAKKTVAGVSMKPKDTWAAMANDLTKLSPELRATGIWDNHLLTDMSRSTASTAHAIQSREHALDHLADLYAQGQITHTAAPGTVPLKTVLADLDLKVGDHTGGAYHALLKRIGVPFKSKKSFEKAANGMGELAVPADTHRFLTEAANGLDGPPAVAGMLKLYDGWNAIVKSVFTSGRPGFHGRNTPSGWANNLMNEQFSGRSIMDGFRAFAGETIPEASKIPGIAQEAAKRGIQQLDDKTATEILSQMYWGADLGGHQHQIGGSLNDILGGIPGEVPGKLSSTLGNLTGTSGNTSWNPSKWRLQGVAGAEHTTMPWLKAGEQVGNFGEHMNRFPAFVELLRQGIDPQEAAKRVRDAQVGYQGRFYTKFEQQVMQRVFLFYKYFKGMVPFTMKQLIEQPSGPLSQALKGLNRAKSPDELTPDWIADTVSLPMGEQPDGSKRYFTGLGLSFEDPLQFATPSAQNLGLETISRMNPILKAPLEYAFGQSTFQKGGIHGGGRPLEDLDPLLGRTIANIGEITGLRHDKAPVSYPGSKLIEHALSNLPTGVPLTMARTATDPRKTPLAKASNLLTGLKLTDVSPAAQDRELRNRVARIEKGLGGVEYKDTYIPKETRAKMSPKDAEAYVQLQAIRQLLEARSKKRKAAKS